MLLLVMGILSLPVLAQTSALAQTSVAPQSPVKPPPATAQSGDAAAKPEKVLTPAQAKQLLAAIPEILQFSSKDTGLASTRRSRAASPAVTPSKNISSTR